MSTFKVVFVIAIMMLCAEMYAQTGVSINTSGNPPDNSAILDVSSTSQGVLIPRMTTTERNGISAPVVGLWIYNTDIDCFQYYSGSGWLNSCGNQSSGNPVTGPCSATGGTASANPTTGSCSGGYTTILDLSGYNGNIQWQSSTDGYYFADIPGEIYPSCTTTVYNSPMYYVAKVTLGSCAMSYSNMVTVTATGCSPFTCNTYGWNINDDRATSVVQTADSGYALAGYTRSFGIGDFDMYVVRLNPDGTIKWTKTIGGANEDEAFSIVSTTDGGFALCGHTTSFGAGGADMYIVKIDSIGNIEWTRTLGGASTDRGLSIIQTSDGGYAAAGYENSILGNTNVYVVKLDASGTVTWTKSIGGSGDERASCIKQTADGGYAISGYTSSYGVGGGYYDMYLIKLDGSGNLSWTATVGGAGNDRANSVIQTGDGGYILGGWTVSYGVAPPTQDFYFAKFNGSGSLQWTKTVGGASNDYMDYNALANTADGGFVAAGFSNSYSATYFDMIVMKFDAAYNLSWTTTTGGNFAECGNCIIQTLDGGYAAVGYAGTAGASTSYDMYFVKLDASGNCCCGTSRSPSISSGGSSSSGGSVNTGGTSNSGGYPNSGGTKTVICN